MWERVWKILHELVVGQIMDGTNDTLAMLARVFFWGSASVAAMVMI